MFDATNLLTQGLDSLNGVDPAVWGLVVETVVGALFASPVVLGIKKWLHLNSDKVILSVAILTSLFTAAGAYVINDPLFSAWLVPVHGWLIFATTQPVYRFLLKPLIGKIQAKIAEAITFNAEVKSAAVPASGLPTSEVTSLGQ
jgi:hypothetical protein